MRVYSRTQGRFIDQPDRVSGVSGQWTPQQQDFQRVAVQDLLRSGGKNISKIKALSEFVAPQGDKKAAASLRKEFSAETKKIGFPTLQTTWQQVKHAADTGAGDLTIVYSYIKALDPTTAVREGEINLTKAAESIPSNIIRTYQRAKKGRAISPKVRQEMIFEVGKMYNERAKQQQQLNAFYSGLASDARVNPQDVIGKIGEIQLAEIPGIQKGKTPSRVGSLLGALLGGAGGFMVGGPIGAGLGGTAGAAGGGATQEMIEDLLGRQTEKGLAPVAEIGKEALKRGGQAYGVASLLNLTRAGKQLRQPGVSLPQKGIAEKLVSAGEGIRKRTPRAILGRKQMETAVSSLEKPKVSKIISAGKKLADIDPDVERLLPKQTPKIKNIKDMQTLIERMQVWGRQAFRKAGGIKGTAKAELYKEFYSAGLEILKEQAPEVYKYRRLLGLVYEIPRTAGKALWKATLGRAALGGF